MPFQGHVLTTKSTVGTVSRSNKGSLRTTIPSIIVEYLGLKFGDKIFWHMSEDGEDDSRIAVISRKRMK